jgi:DNA-binding MarR family transcriptional regulator
MTATRTKKLQELFESFQTIRRGMVLPKTSESPVGALSGITLSQWMVLRLIEQNTGGTVKYIASELGISSSATTQLIDGLVRDGYVLRREHTTDRRLVELRLSSKAKKEIGAVQKRILTKLEHLFHTLTDTEFDQYVRLNKKITERLKTKTEKLQA